MDNFLSVREAIKIFNTNALGGRKIPHGVSNPVFHKNENGDYLIPIVLIENYINGIDVVYDDEEMICKVINDIGKSDIELTLHLPEEMEKADFPDSYKDYFYETSGKN